MRFVTAPLLCHAFEATTSIADMAKKNAIRAREGRRRREELKKQPLHINVPVEPRTLKRSARKRMERERAPSLWIMPWVDYTHAGGGKGRVYPANHLLGLPTETRQNIMYHTYSIAQLEADVRKQRWDDRNPVRRRRNLDVRDLPMAKTMKKSLQQTIDVNNHQAKLVTMLSRRVGVLNRVSPLIQREMEYVSQSWQADLEAYMQRKLKVKLHELGWLLQPNLPPYMTQKQGQVVKARRRGAGKTRRYMKCWYCTERHARDEKMCPMARRDPKEWKKMTKKIGGRRGRAQEKLVSRQHAKKVLFE